MRAVRSRSRSRKRHECGIEHFFFMTLFDMDMVTPHTTQTRHTLVRPHDCIMREQGTHLSTTTVKPLRQTSQIRPQSCHSRDCFLCLEDVGSTSEPVSTRQSVECGHNDRLLVEEEGRADDDVGGE